MSKFVFEKDNKIETLSEQYNVTNTDSAASDYNI